MIQSTLLDSSQSKSDPLALLKKQTSKCGKCSLHKNRTNIVFGEGTYRAPIAFVGEGPGEQEDRLGRPFVGPSGKLLDKMIQACGFDRKDLYICNVVKCRPPQNRKPEGVEIEECGAILKAQIKIVKPKLIVTLGATAASFLTKTEEPLAVVRGKWHSWGNYPVMPTWHPAYLLRQSGLDAKAATWSDLKSVISRFNKMSIEEETSIAKSILFAIRNRDDPEVIRYERALNTVNSNDVSTIERTSLLRMAREQLAKTTKSADIWYAVQKIVNPDDDIQIPSHLSQK